MFEGWKQNPDEAVKDMLAIPKELSSHLSKVEGTLATCLEKDPPLFRDMLKYVLLSGGKRLRPALALLGYFSTGGAGPEEVLDYAAAMELLHTASIIHEDIIEGSPLRRGTLTVAGKFGSSNAMIGGDYFIVKATSMITRYGLPLVRDVLSSIMLSAEGIAEETLNSYRPDVGENQYIEYITKKVSSLISQSVAGGAMISGADEKMVQCLREYGLNLGLVHQLSADILDIASSSLISKPPGSNIREGRLTLPVIYAIREIEEGDKQYLQDVFSGKKELSDSEVGRIIGLIKQTRAAEKTKAVIGGYIEKALNSIKPLPETEWKKHLMNIVYMIASREV